jgi:hypothetical protein
MRFVLCGNGNSHGRSEKPQSNDGRSTHYSPVASLLALQTMMTLVFSPNCDYRKSVLVCTILLLTIYLRYHVAAYVFQIARMKSLRSLQEAVIV